MRSISIPWSSLFRRSLKVISTFFTSFLARALLLYNIWAHCTCKLLHLICGKRFIDANLDLQRRMYWFGNGPTVALRKGIWAQSRYKKRRRQKQTKEIMADFFCSETADSKNICILYDNAAALILSLTARIARQKKQKNQQQQRLRCLFFEKSWGLFGLEMPAVKLKSTCFGKLVF